MKDQITLKTQIGTSMTADFEDGTWTFKMQEDYRVMPGKFAIVDKILYDRLLKDIVELHVECMNLDVPNRLLDKILATINNFGVISQ